MDAKRLKIIFIGKVFQLFLEFISNTFGKLYISNEDLGHQLLDCTISINPGKNTVPISLLLDSSKTKYFIRNVAKNLAV